MAADLNPSATLLYRSGAAKDYPLTESASSVGYDSGNQVRVRIEGVSRRHARITFDGTDYWIEDVGSSNGTFLNGVLVARRERLRHLDVVSLGRRTDLIFVRKAVGGQRTRRRGIVAAWLQTLDGPEAGDRREIPRGVITFGRSPANNVVVNSQLVSKAHARIERVGIEMILTDLQSANGTFIDGKPINSRTLEDRDEFSLGKARAFRVFVEEGEIETSKINLAPTTSRTVAGLPTDWRTRLEWTPEEQAVFEKARRETPPPAPKPAPAARSAPRSKPQPAKVASEAPDKPESKPAQTRRPAPQPPPRAKPQPGVPPEPADGSAQPEPPVEAKPQSPPSSPRVAGADVQSEAAPAQPPSPPDLEAAGNVVPAVVPEAPAPAPRIPAAALAASHVAGEMVAVPRPPAPASTPALGSGTRPRVVFQGKLQTFMVGAGDHDVGRVAECAVRIESPQISRRHALIHVTADEVVIEDLKSANGTFVNGKRVAHRQTLADGDEVRFGDFGFQVRLSSDPTS